MAKKKSSALRAVEGPIKLDLGCGTRKQPGFVGVDAIDFVGVDTVLSLAERDWSFLESCKDWREGVRRAFEAPSFVPWPWADNSVDEVYSSHFLEHLTGTERVHFMNELHRVLKVGAKATIIVPHWSNACAYGDPTHQWSPMSEWFSLYLDKGWRAVNAPHSGYTCDFEYVVGFSFDERVLSYNDERRTYALTHSLNAARDMHATLTKRG